MQLDCEITAARRQASRLAGLVLLPPGGRPRPPFGDRPHGSHKGQCPLTPHRALWARGRSGDMQLGCEATAARQRASRLAGLVRLPAVWPIQTAIRRQASWLAITASMDLKSRWPFVLQKYQAASKHPNPQGLRMPPPTMNQNSRPLISAAKILKPQRSIPTRKG